MTGNTGADTTKFPTSEAMECSLSALCQDDNVCQTLRYHQHKWYQIDEGYSVPINTSFFFYLTH